MAGSRTGLVKRRADRPSRDTGKGDKSMSIFEGMVGPLSRLIDRVIPDPKARDEAKLELLEIVR